jgi:predicted signal transduction protein with EAL and GGDEF domain
VVAEGVETAEHLAILKDLGCDLGQGFFVSQPLPVDRLTTWFGQTPWVERAVRSVPRPDRRRPARGPSRVSASAVDI